MDHRAAFQCQQCPRNNDPARGRSCPAWWEWTAENVTNGETKIVRMCGWQAMPQFLTEVIKASNRPAAAVESTRNEIAAGLGRMATALERRMEQLERHETRLLTSPDQTH